MIQVLKYGEPILKVKYIEDESDYEIGMMAVLVNLSYDNKKEIFIENIPLQPMKGTITGYTTIPYIDKAVIVESFYKAGGEQGHNMRMWRDLAEDLSLEGRLKLASEGIQYIREQFGGTRDDF